METVDELLQRDTDAEILDEAKARHKFALSWESDARKNWLEDYRFSNGDSENLYQWPDNIKNGREKDSKPNLTINKVRQHNLQIINDAKQNKPSVKVRPVSDEASFEAAEVLEGIVRHIEYQSKAQVAYDTATSFQVQAGLGALRVDTDYADEETFDQEIYIRRVRDPLTVLFDPDAAEADYSDGRFAFVFEDVPRDRFDIQYPEFKDLPNLAAFGSSIEDWVSKDHVRVAEYWRRLEVGDELLLMVDPNSGKTLYARKSDVPKSIYDAVIGEPTTRKRDIIRKLIQHFIIVGDSLVKREPWAGIYIPLIPVIGEETIIAKRLDRKGHTRALRDPQRMYNYWTSEATAQIALQTKTPYIGSAASIEGYENYWETANTTDSSILPYNATDDDGNPLAAPTREQPPMPAQAYLTGMQVAANEMMMVSGQYEAQMGQQGNERSGKAIAERQRQGDNATYHYIDNLAIAIRQVGRIILDLIPKVYDQPRVMRILGEDGSERAIELDPNARQAYEKHKQEDSVREIFNPLVGKYDVQADIGPSYSTQRQEAWNAFVQIVGQAPQLMSLVGDLMFRAADFPMADEIAERLKRTIPPGVTGDAPPEAFQQAMQQAQQTIQALLGQNNQLKAQLEGAASKLTQKDLQLTAADQKRIVDAYNAETNRMKILQGAVDPKELANLAAQLVLDTLKTPMGPAMSAAEQDLTRATGSFGQQVPPSGQPLAQEAQQGAMSQDQISALGDSAANSSQANIPPGAIVAKDGNHYVPDPRRPGKYLLIVNG